MLHYEPVSHVAWTICINFRPPSHEISTYNLTLIGQAVWEKIFDNDEETTTAENGYTISSSNGPNGSGELKRHENDDNLIRLLPFDRTKYKSLIFEANIILMKNDGGTPKPCFIVTNTSL